jgi:hypothetical protein
MAMSNSLLIGWDIWLEVDGRFCKLTIAINDLDAAQKLALERVPNAKISYVAELPHEVMRALQAQPGQIAEWGSSDPNTPLKPPNLRN